MTYPSVPHPEDAPGFGAYPAYTPDNTPDAPTQGSGVVDVFAAVKWAFRAVFSNKRVWILGSFLLLLVLGVVGASLGVYLAKSGVDLFAASGIAGNLTMTILGAVSTVLVTPFLYSGALAQVDKEKGRWSYFFENLNYGSVAITALLATAINYSLSYAVSGIFGLLGSLMGETGEAALAGIGALIGGILGIFLAPLIYLWDWFAADGQDVKSAIRKGIEAGKWNYWQLLLYGLLAPIVVGILCLSTLGLGLLVFPAVYLLSNAHIARQASGGVVPART
ncbi:hypothetical protein [Corynebacterium sp. 22KM0430]|uniref:hypothetical protein n=1 Tax=Corynebacterium sp. 22KM0430 TaxID=2989735 RepID=UPI0029CA4F6F|nr:hypothetical protein [Corynebacterium sp. 22KM0430]WPF65249.1 hypothetical protein OLX12_06565 [Corynebacterium sp. 22KM0430]